MFTSSSSSRYVAPVPEEAVDLRLEELVLEASRQIGPVSRQELLDWNSQQVIGYPGEELWVQYKELLLDAAEQLKEAEDARQDEHAELEWLLYFACLERLRDKIREMTRHQEDWFMDQLGPN